MPHSDTKTLDYYMSLPYTVEARRTEDGWFAKVVELPGCMTWTGTLEGLGPMIEDAMATWIQGSIDEELPIPEPAEGFSGRILVRMPKSLHRDLTRRAEDDGVSLNQLITTRLARSVGE